MASTSNPAFGNDAFTNFEQVYGAAPSTTMTIAGTVGKTAALLAVLSATALWSWSAAEADSLPGYALPVAAIGGLVLALVTIFKKTAAPYTAPAYAAFQGVFLGAISYLIENQLGRKYPGIALQAVSLTASTLLVMLFIYGTGMIRVTDRLRTGIVAATSAICLVYLVSFLLSMFGVAVPFFRGATPLSIGFSFFVVGLAAFNLLLDFDSIDRGVRGYAPKYMEWYGAFGLMVTLIWLYLEILKLLRKLQDRR